MQLIIDISDNLYDVIKYDKYGLHKGKLYDIIRNGIPLIEEKSLRVENNLTIEKYQHAIDAIEKIKEWLLTLQPESEATE